MEPSLERHPELERALPDLRTRLKAAAIASDLRFLGWEPGPVAATRALDDEAHAWGALYVLEGSTLGTTTIGRLVREH
ncbi:MAG: hypothetical protein KDK70_30435, partial [Myxococcales bacterium]|nr:hypothetical protein [Myxococcales bacterium]